MKYITRISLFESGERFSVLLYENTFQPVILPLRYVVEERRDTRQIGTIEREVRVLKWLYEWADNRGINLEEFLRAGKLFSAGEITGFCRYLRTLRNSQVVGAVGTSAEILSPPTFNSYLNVVQAFLTWAAREFIPNNTPEREIGLATENARDKIKRAFSTNRMGERIAHKIGLNEDEVTELQNAVDPQSPKNPFKPACRFRNQLIILLLLLTGIRRGELLKLKITHLPQGSKQTLTVMRFPGDKSDPRRIRTAGQNFGARNSDSETIRQNVMEIREKASHQRQTPVSVYQPPKRRAAQFINSQFHFRPAR